MAELREREGVSFLYITHDIASARYVADRLMVMYAGHIVESGPTEARARRPEAPVHAAAAVGGAGSAGAAGGRGEATSASRRGSSTRARAAGSGCGARWRSRSAAGSRRCRGSWPRRTARPATSPPRPGYRNGRAVKIAVVGGGSTYTPELDRGVRPPGRRAGGGRAGAARHRRRAARRRRRRWPGGSCARQGFPGRLVTTTSLDSAVDGAAAVLVQLRVGGQAGPAGRRDAARPVRAASARRPPVRAASPRRCAPCRSCWTSPRRCAGAPGPTPGSSTSPTRSASSPARCWTPGTARSGCATSAIGFQRRLAASFGVDADRVRLGHAGLNHLSWIRSVARRRRGPAARAARRRRASPSWPTETGVPAGAAARPRRDPVVLPALLLLHRPRACGPSATGAHGPRRSWRSSGRCSPCTPTRPWTTSRRCWSSAAAPTTARPPRRW